MDLILLGATMVLGWGSISEPLVNTECKDEEERMKSFCLFFMSWVRVSMISGFSLHSKTPGLKFLKTILPLWLALIFAALSWFSGNWNFSAFAK
jgi:hypothetical protein